MVCDIDIHNIAVHFDCISVHLTVFFMLVHIILSSLTLSISIIDLNRTEGRTREEKEKRRNKTKITKEYVHTQADRQTER